jgi:hypothetical protein
MNGRYRRRRRRQHDHYHPYRACSRKVVQSPKDILEKSYRISTRIYPNQYRCH